MNTTNELNEEKIVKKLSLMGIVGNIILTAFKLFSGIYGKSGAMVSDAVHSLSDVFATAIALIGVKLSQKEADSKHPYGHERFECVASLFLGLILGVTGIGIGKTGIDNIRNYQNIAIPGVIALVAAVVSIVTKEAMARYTLYYAKKINSSAFIADAWHHRSDALSSIGSLVGIGGAMLGYPVMDSIACVIICALILKVSFDILKDAISKMLDTSCGEKYENELKDFIEEQEGVVCVDTLNTRQFGNKVYIDLEMQVDGEMTLAESHGIADRVHDTVEESYPDIKHIMIHLNPAEPEDNSAIS